jgi:hypothetical protein
METVILGGPSLALTSGNNKRYYTVINAETTRSLAAIEIDVAAKRRSLIIHEPSSNEDSVAAILHLIMTVLQNKFVPVTASDSNGILFAYMLNGTMESKDPTIVKAWTSLTFELELVSEDGDLANRVRFSGTNIQGVKNIAKASSVTFTISAK